MQPFVGIHDCPKTLQHAYENLEKSDTLLKKTELVAGVMGYLRNQEEDNTWKWYRIVLPGYRSLLTIELEWAACLLLNFYL